MSTDISAMKEQFIDNTKVGLFVMEFVAFIWFILKIYVLMVLLSEEDW